MTKQELINKIKKSKMELSFDNFFENNPEYIDDRDIMQAIVSRDGSNILKLPIKYQNDIDIAKIAVITTPSSFKYLSPVLTQNRAFILTLIKQDGSLLEYCSNILKNDKDIVLAAINNHGTHIYYASDILRENISLALKAVLQDKAAYFDIGSAAKKHPVIEWLALKSLPYPTIQLDKIKDLISKHEADFLKPDPVIDALIQDSPEYVPLLADYIELKYNPYMPTSVDTIVYTD